MGNEEEIKELEEQLENIRKNKMEVQQSFSHVPDIQAKILRNLEEQEGLLLARIREKKEKQG